MSDMPDCIAISAGAADLCTPCSAPGPLQGPPRSVPDFAISFASLAGSCSCSNGDHGMCLSSLYLCALSLIYKGSQCPCPANCFDLFIAGTCNGGGVGRPMAM